MRAETKKVIKSIREMMDQRGIQMETIWSKTQDSIYVRTIDADPATQQTINEICKQHQLGRSYLMLDSYEFNNIRDDIPQTNYVLTFHEITNEMAERIERFIQENLPESAQSQLGWMECWQHLFKGHIPGLWGQENGEPHPPCCCVCQKPAANTENAHSRRIGTTRIYRHWECGDFSPTPTRDER